ncbi:MAG: hypothetical protein U0996_21830 [Planctomycetaceae bacterium]
MPENASGNDVLRKRKEDWFGDGGDQWDDRWIRLCIEQLLFFVSTARCDNLPPTITNLETLNRVADYCGLDSEQFTMILCLMFCVRESQNLGDDNPDVAKLIARIQRLGTRPAQQNEPPQSVLLRLVGDGKCIDIKRFFDSPEFLWPFFALFPCFSPIIRVTAPHGYAFVANAPLASVCFFIFSAILFLSGANQSLVIALVALGVFSLCFWGFTSFWGYSKLETRHDDYAGDSLEGFCERVRLLMENEESAEQCRSVQ